MVTEDKAQDEDGPARPQPSQRLGKAELGRYAFETRMPGWLERHLRNTHLRQTPDLIPVLAQLCETDQALEAAYLCHPAVTLVNRTRREGPYFCGYRNVQMLLSYMLGAGAVGCERLKVAAVTAELKGNEEVPDVLVLQELIEQAWERGGDDDERVETGGIRGTRKFIGTPEARSFFRSLDIPCRAAVYSSSVVGAEAWQALLTAVEAYFCSAIASTFHIPGEPKAKVVQTLLPPIYLQRPQHSLTIVGIERRRRNRAKKNDADEVRRDSSVNLLVFDPAFRSGRQLRRLAARMHVEAGKNGDVLSPLSARRAKRLLKPFQRGERELHLFERFETLILTGLAGVEKHDTDSGKEQGRVLDT